MDKKEFALLVFSAAVVISLVLCWLDVIFKV